MRSVTRTRILWIASGASLALAAAVSGCSSSSNGSPNYGGDGGGSSSSGSSSGGSSSGGSSSGGSSSGGSSSSSGGVTTDAGEAGTSEAGASADGGDASCTTLSVFNFKSWCSVTVNGGTASTAAELPAACLPEGSVTLTAAPASGTFELGPDPWVYISGTGGTDSGVAGTVVGSTSTATVVLGSTPGCVLVCCPFTNGTGCTSAESGYTAFLANCP
jgi:hypothetical protein